MSIVEREPSNVATSPSSITMHEALHKLLVKVDKAGHNVNKVANVSLTVRRNPQSGEHCHASCSIKLRFDESVTEQEAVDSINKY